ncbi:MAG: sulfite exporter TauE/SafE family protein [Actinobacteria bacterium]|nr:sulfite exporter TauE/SafE family protein [Actinomycetota bacterium]
MTFLGLLLAVFMGLALGLLGGGGSILAVPILVSLFAVVMLIAAFFMFRDNESDEDSKDSFSDGSTRRLLLWLAAPGLGVGVLTGLVGVGGGFLIVPALVLIAGVQIEAAVGTSLLIIAMNSLAGFAGYLGKAEMQWGLMALFTALAVLGSFAGAYLVRFVPSGALQKVFAVFLVVMAIFILYENRGAFL